MSKVIICANQKGGVAKTTTTINVGIGLARFPDMEVRGSIPEELEKSNNVDKVSPRRMGHHR